MSRPALCVNLFDTCGDETPFCLLIFWSDNPVLKCDYHKPTLFEKNDSEFSIWQWLGVRYRISSLNGSRSGCTGSLAISCVEARGQVVCY